MERLCDELLQLIFYDLDDPSSLTWVSKRFHRFSQEPYVRAHYFLNRYGQTEALFHALGRGKVLTERVLDILLSSGAHISRYLVQLSIHHYFFTQNHFIKTHWVRNVPLRTFLYFLNLAEELYGEIPRGKGEDDGTTFSLFLKESRLPKSMKTVTWEKVQELLEKYNFIPFSSKDPITAQFPLALSIEPRLLPYAATNGFSMNRKHRDYVFRKMFERPAVPSESNPDDVVNNAKELCQLDPSMFISRTVAAEICMEAKANEIGYSALKKLNATGSLRFELGDLVEELIKSFIRTRSISSAVSIDILRFLYSEFPTHDPTARLVILITVFITSENLQSSPSAVQGRLDELGLAPLTRRDVCNILMSPFVDRYSVLLGYARWGIGTRKDGSRGMDDEEIRSVVEEVSEKCLEIACKGRLLKKLYDGFPFLRDQIQHIVQVKYKLALDDFPPAQERDACHRYQVRLCKDPQWDTSGLPPDDATVEEPSEPMDTDRSGDEDDDWMEGESEAPSETSTLETHDDASTLGTITQETLTSMIRQDEVSPGRTRRRLHHLFGFPSDSSSRLPYLVDYVPVAKWVKSEFGPRSRVTAIFMLHAVVNSNSSILGHYLYPDAGITTTRAQRVPVTLKHFQILAHLSRAPNFWVYHEIEEGAEFYVDEEEYLQKDAEQKVKLDHQDPDVTMAPIDSPEQSDSNGRSKKRPRRTTTKKVHSYAIPDSDDETFMDEDVKKRPKRVLETNLQKWIRNLGQIAKEEQRKFREEKKIAEIAAEPGTKVRLNKNEFFKSLSLQLRNLRRKDLQERVKLNGCGDFGDFTEDEDDDDYGNKSRTKRRRHAP